MNFPNDRAELRQRWDAGERFDFYFFYGHKKPDSGVDASCLSQWFYAGFDVDGQHYPTAEHWMMAEKARLFNDAYMLKEILVAPDPKTAKLCGRKVSGFCGETWNASRVEIVTQGQGQVDDRCQSGDGVLRRRCGLPQNSCCVRRFTPMQTEVGAHSVSYR